MIVLNAMECIHTCTIPITDECPECHGVYSHVYNTKNWWVSWMLWSVFTHVLYQELMSVFECYGVYSHMYYTKNWWVSLNAMECIHTCIIPRTDDCLWMQWSVFTHVLYQELMIVFECYGVYSHMYHTKNWWVSLNAMECIHTCIIPRTDECLWMLWSVCTHILYQE
jgi:hypothetical protein